jgi:flagellar FliL protein
LNTREGKETLRNQTLAEIQKVMTEETGDAGVDSVFFTSFVMQ